MLVAMEDQPVAMLALTDRLRAAAPATFTALAALSGRDPILLTGDAARTGPRAIAVDAGIRD